MMSAEILAVSGQGRCGSSLVMQMLAAGGVPVIGDYPAYEDQRVFQPKLFRQFVGKGVKLLDPHRNYIPKGFEYRWIFVSRDPKQQAKSMVKFMKWLGGPKLRKNAVELLERSLQEDEPKCLNVLASLGGEVLHLRFEDVLASPYEAAERIARHIGLDVKAATKMASVVISRPPECLPYMLETRLTVNP